MSDEQAPRLVFDFRRDSPFSFTCRACSRCCQDKIILVGPHEILGMSRALGIATTEFLARYTREGGTALRTTEDGRCVFVGPDGCRVHPRRPLVCRLYPLGRRTDEEGRESFALYGAFPGCEATVGRDGTVAGFLNSQGVGPYIEWSRRYSGIYRRMIELMSRAEPGPDIENTAAQEVENADKKQSSQAADATDTGQVQDPDGHAAGQPEPGPGPGPAPLTANPLLSPWLDIDASLAEHCAARGLTPPADIDAAIDLHIRAMEEWLDDLERQP